MNLQSSSNSFLFLKNVLLIFLSICLVVVFAACGGGGGGTPPDDNGGGDTETVFPGGSLDDLRALNQDLNFGKLKITGTLKLPNHSSTTLTVKDLIITEDGGISYSYSTCEYVASPHLSISASGNVEISGPITLYGRSGTRVTSTASCNSCYGQDGGGVSITAKTISIKSNLWNYGGSGGTSVFYGGSSGCSGGASGTTSLEAGDIDLSGADVDSHAGSGGSGSVSNGSRGAAKDFVLKAANMLRMKNGSISASGDMIMQAQQTEIYGPIAYGALFESIGGTTDNAGPEVTITSPLAGSSVSLNEPLNVSVQTSDSGTGVKQIQVVGFGNDLTYSALEVQNGVLTATIASPTTPPDLAVTVTDNKGNSTMESVSGLSVSYGAEAEPNDSPTMAQTATLPFAIEGDIHRTDNGSTTILVPVNPALPSDQKVQDWYRFTISADNTDVQIDMDFSGHASATDLDIYLTREGTTLNYGKSEKDNAGLGDYTESIATKLNSGTYLVAVRAWNTPARTNYILSIR